MKSVTRLVRRAVLWFVVAVPLVAQQGGQTGGAPSPAAGTGPATVPVDKQARPEGDSRRSSISPVKFDENGYPKVPGGPSARPAFLEQGRPKNVPSPAPAGETGAGRTPQPASTAAATSEPRGRAPALASGMEFGSPLLDIYQRVRAPGTFKALGGRTVWWRLTVFGEQGEIIGRREVTHLVDCAFAERDRLEFEDGRVYGRSGPVVYAERQGMAWPTLNESAAEELALFGLQWRMPWCFADGVTYAVVGRDQLTRSGEGLARVVVERRPPAAFDTVGPELDPKPRDHFELLYEPASGQPREFVHRFANSRQTRRLLLEDWRDVDGVQVPFRRIYVDDSGRQTTMLEILRVEATTVSERAFRLL